MWCTAGPPLPTPSTQSWDNFLKGGCGYFLVQNPPLLLFCCCLPLARKSFLSSHFQVFSLPRARGRAGWAGLGGGGGALLATGEPSFGKARLLGWRQGETKASRRFPLAVDILGKLCGRLFFRREPFPVGPREKDESARNYCVQLMFPLSPPVQTLMGAKKVFHQSAFLT